MEQLHPSEIDLGLERIAKVAQRLGIEKSSSKVITIGGTNGKGSCVATLESFLIKAGKRVGAYTSPHVLRYNERIKINGHQIQDAELCEYFARIDQARGDISLTYFELGTLAAMLAFVANQLDYWLLEVGLGGRLDAVNIMEPDVAVITSIDFDHEQWLGETRDAIAREKFGILRSSSLLVCAEQDLPASAQTIVETLGCTTFNLGQEFTLQDKGEQYEFRIALPEADAVVIPLDKHHLHLPQNSVAAALQVLALTNELPAVEVCQKVLSELHLRGRFELLEHNGVKVILDVAHNPAAVKKLAQQLRQSGNTQVNAVFAMMADKKIATALQALEGLVHHWFCAQIPDLPRSAKSEQLANILVEAGADTQNVSCYSSVEAALTEAMRDVANQAQPANVCVLVFGSFYTVADAHMYFTQHRL
ncbi:Dihydrofolate synthase/folylpolyglutamate synthase [Thalassocella blandensis]|nr:Dihydrofolate synthase/folylpolyglutamate synthase [Thalassocella blandensis]